MINIDKSLIPLDDLPDEILLIIFQKLSNIDVLYSLINANERIKKIVQDSIFTSRLTLLRDCGKDHIYSLLDSKVDRFCLDILPQIHQKIKWLNLESSTMERILLATTYPNLYGLGLYRIPNATAVRLFTDETSFLHTIKTQITSLVINLIYSRSICSAVEMETLAFTHVFTVFTNLRNFNFCPFSTYFPRLSFDISFPVISCSTLLNLHVNVERFRDCLYLLDGRFSQLQSLYVNFTRLAPLNSTINNKDKLPNLRIFSLYCEILSDGYDELVVPLLQRMSNLEELQLHIVTISDEKIIDGNDLKKDILNSMPQLNQFGFNILSHAPFDNLDDLPSNANIQKTLNDLKNNLIMSRIDFFPSISRGQCHIYSYPYKIPYYNYVTNNFPGGLFKHVYEVSLHDERPFEHEFFLQIAQSFPLMKKLTLDNKELQKNKQCYGSKRDDPDFSLVKYPHLSELYLDDSHDDYVEQFFLDTKMSLSNNISLHIRYESLQRVTNHFTREATRINCGKVAHLYMFGFKGTKELKVYFPFVKIH